IDGGADEVSSNNIPRGIGYHHAPGTVGANEVRRAGDRSPNNIAAGVVEVDTRPRVAQCRCSGKVGPDTIALNLIGAGAAAENIKAYVAVGRDDITSAGASDSIGSGAFKVNAETRIAHSSAAGNIRTYQVP